MVSGRSAEIGQGIHRGAVHPHLKVAVGAGGPAGAARLGDLLSLVHLLSCGHQQGRVMAVIGLGAVVVGDDDQIAIAPLVAGEGDGAAVCRLDGRTVGGGDIDAGVVAVTAENIPPAKVGGDPPPDGPGCLLYTSPSPRDA